MHSTNTQICNKILSQMFQTEIPLEYTADDIESAQMAYLTGGNCSVKHLHSFKSKCPSIVIETILILYDSLEISGLTCFPFNFFRELISTGDISITQALCESRQNFFINLLYSVCNKKENTKQFLSNISVILSFKNCHKILRNREIWGLSRARCGVETKEDCLIMKFCYNYNLDITTINKVKKLIHSKEDIYDDFMVDDRHVETTGPEGLKKVYLNPEAYKLPFFLQDLFSQITGFTPEQIIKPADILENGNIINQIYEILYPLLLDPEIKNNFCDFIANVCMQDRSKLVFKEDENCSDSFCYTLYHLLLKFAKGILNKSFIYKIDDKKFPTFCFFYISRLMEISIYRLLGDLKENYNKENTLLLIFFEFSSALEYLNFVFDLIEERRNEVLLPLIKFYQNLNNSQDNLNGMMENVSINASQKDINTFIEESTGILQFTPKESKATNVSQILNDSAFINTILSLYSFYIRPDKGFKKSAMTLINCIFAYKNTFANECLYILIRANPILNKSLISRMVILYSSKDENNYYEARHLIHEILKDYDLDVNRESMRMISACLGGMEENLSQIFDFIQKINSYKEIGAKLNKIIRETNEECSLSEDEEQITLIPSHIIEYISKFTEAQLDQFLNERFDDENINKVKADFIDQLKYRNNPFKLKLIKKIKVNTIRMERSEKGLKGCNGYLINLLIFLKSHTLRNKKIFLNKNIFFRLFSIVNSALNLLVGDKSSKIKILNKESYDLDPKEILRLVAMIIINMLKSNEKLVITSGLDQELTQKVVDLCSSKHILNEENIQILKVITDVLRKSKKTEDHEKSPVLEEIPDEFLDPLTFTLMKNPVIMSTSKITIDMSTFNQIMLNDQLDPFSRMPINEKLISVDTELKQRIEEFLKEKGFSE